MLTSRSDSYYVNLQTEQRAEETEEEENEERRAIHSEFDFHSQKWNDPFESQCLPCEYLEENRHSRRVAYISSKFLDQYE